MGLLRFNGGSNGSALTSPLNGFTCDTSGGKFTDAWSYEGNLSATTTGTGNGFWVKRSIGSNPYLSAVFNITEAPNPMTMLIWGLKSGYFHGFAVDSSLQLRFIDCAGSSGSSTVLTPASGGFTGGPLRADVYFGATSAIRLWMGAQRASAPSYTATGGNMSAAYLDNGEMWAGPFMCNNVDGAANGRYYGLGTPTAGALSMDYVEDSASWPDRNPAIYGVGGRYRVA